MRTSLPRRTAALQGFAGVAAWAVLRLAAIALYSNQVVRDNRLSDLGHAPRADRL